MTNMRGPLAIAAPLVIATSLFVTIAWAQDQDDPGDAEAVRTIAPQLPGLVAAFRRDQSDSDRQVVDASPDGMEAGDLRPGEAPGHARRLGLGTGVALYAWPARGEVCVSTGSSGGCVSTELLARRGVLVGTRFVGPSAGTPAPIRHAFVLARDGVDEVEIRTEDGHSLVADTHKNGAVVELSAEFVSARWLNVDGTQGVQRVAGP
jgi:hypothetical protein